jgi:transposase InsO family protein
MLDAWSRKVVGCSINKRATTAMVNDPIAMAITQRARRDGVLIHLNLGPHYTSRAYSQNVGSSGLVQSLGTVSDAKDHAVIEPFWGSMQIKLLNRETCDTRIALTGAMVDWIEAFCNRRRHLSLGYISPNKYERRHQQPKAASLSETKTSSWRTRQVAEHRGRVAWFDSGAGDPIGGPCWTANRVRLLGVDGGSGLF